MNIYIVGMDTSINITPSINSVNKKNKRKISISICQGFFSPIILFLKFSFENES